MSGSRILINGRKKCTNDTRKDALNEMGVVQNKEEYNRVGEYFVQQWMAEDDDNDDDDILNVVPFHNRSPNYQLYTTATYLSQLSIIWLKLIHFLNLINVIEVLKLIMKDNYN